MIIFIDDILVYSKNVKEHAFHLKIFLQTLRETIVYKVLEVWVLDGIFVDPKKFEAIVNWERSKNVTKIWNLMGLVEFYRQFVKHFSLSTASLT